MSPSKISDVKFDEFYNIINGEKRNASNQHHGIDPCTGDQLWPVPIGTQTDVDDAVKAAKKAFEKYRDTSLAERKEKLLKFKDALLAHTDEFVQLLSSETGKPTATATMEVSGIVPFFDYHVTLDIPEDRDEDDEKVITTRYTPIGVVGGIVPWNFPIALSIGKIIPALLTGNTIIIKPSPYTPYTALKIIEIAQQIYDPGVIQVIGGNDSLGPMLTAHPDIGKISFTGSIATGKKIMAACAQTLKRVTLELGGNDPSIVLPDVDVEKVAPQLVLGAFYNSAQVCVAAKRFFIHKSIYNEVLEAMVRFTQTLTVGAPSQNAHLGPVQNRMQYDKVVDYFRDSKERGYTFAVGPQDVAPGKGFFVQPTIIDNPPNDSRIVQEEPFGPIVPTQPWDDEEEVIRLANDTNAGLGACVWGKDVAHAEAIGRRLEAGSVWINSFEKPSPTAFFSGVKESGVGGVWGKEGLKSYCNAQVMHSYKV